jgi:hypothetical protein
MLATSSKADDFKSGSPVFSYKYSLPGMVITLCAKEFCKTVPGAEDKALKLTESFFNRVSFNNRKAGKQIERVEIIACQLEELFLNINNRKKSGKITAGMLLAFIQNPERQKELVPGSYTQKEFDDLERALKDVSKDFSLVTYSGVHFKVSPLIKNQKPQNGL